MEPQTAITVEPLTVSQSSVLTQPPHQNQYKRLLIISTPQKREKGAPMLMLLDSQTQKRS